MLRIHDYCRYPLPLVPPIYYVTDSNSHANPIRPYGTTVTLTCTVELSPLVDVAVNISTVWSGPAGFMAMTTAQSVIGSNTTYSSTAMISSFGREQSGDYNCITTISSTSPYLINSISTGQTFKALSVGEATCYIIKLIIVLPL